MEEGKEGMILESVVKGSLSWRIEANLIFLEGLGRSEVENEWSHGGSVWSGRLV